MFKREQKAKKVSADSHQIIQNGQAICRAVMFTYIALAAELDGISLKDGWLFDPVNLMWLPPGTKPAPPKVAENGAGVVPGVPSTPE